MSALIQIALKLVSMTGLGGTIGHMLAGDSGEKVAQKIVGIASAVTGEDEPSKALTQLQSNDKLRLQFEDRVFENEERLAELSANDRQDARAMQEHLLESEHAGWFARNFVYLIGAVLLIFGLAYSTAVTFMPLTPQGERYADQIINFMIIGGIAGPVLKFFFGGGPSAPGGFGKKRLRGLGDYGQ